MRTVVRCPRPQILEGLTLSFPWLRGAGHRGWEGGDRGVLGALRSAHLEVTPCLLLHHVPGNLDSKILCLNGLTLLLGPVGAALSFLLKADSTVVSRAQGVPKGQCLHSRHCRVGGSWTWVGLPVTLLWRLLRGWDELSAGLRLGAALPWAAEVGVTCAGISRGPRHWWDLPEQELDGSHLEFWEFC